MCNSIVVCEFGKTEKGIFSEKCVSRGVVMIPVIFIVPAVILYYRTSLKFQTAKNNYFLHSSAN